MGDRKSRKGPRRRGGRKRGASNEGQGGGENAHNRAVADGASGSSRLRLTRLLREETVWDVFVATTTAAGARNRVLLEFVSGGAGRSRQCYRRPADGPLLEALHNGSAVRRSDLERELDLAIRDAEEGVGDQVSR